MRDRYVGTLHEINSETSTVALEQVTSHGTEGRRGGEGEIAGSENVYEYIVFRGSDVKDLRIEEPAQKKPQMPPPQLDDPAILGVRCPWREGGVVELGDWCFGATKISRLLSVADASAFPNPP
jgi:hypothetical protein